MTIRINYSNKPFLKTELYIVIVIMKRKSKQWWSTISTNRTTTSLFRCL